MFILFKRFHIRSIHESTVIRKIRKIKNPVYQCLFPHNAFLILNDLFIFLFFFSFQDNAARKKTVPRALGDMAGVVRSEKKFFFFLDN